MKVEIYSREAIKELMQGEFPNNTAVISFCSPRKTRRAEEVRVYFGNVCDRVFNILIPDIDIEILGDYGYTYETYLAEADELAKFIYEVRAEGRDIICQCDFGQSRSAACAAAILQHFEGRGIDIFSDYRYYPNQLVYHKVFDALEKLSTNANGTSMFFITCFEKCEKDERGCFDTGDIRTFGYFDNLEACKEALNENICDMHEYLYEFAVIESIGQGIHPHTKELAWFRWNDKKQGFFEIENPECTRKFSNYGLG